MSKLVNWGIIGPGVIAGLFVNDLARSPHARVAAVGSSSVERARDFAGQHGIPRAYGSYDELVRDPEVDIVYIATLHPAHRENALAAIAAGKAVLCEKSFTMNASELRDIIAAARARKLFAMEAMWTRFLPAIVKVREWLGSGVIGDVRQVNVSFGNLAPWNPDSRLFSPQLGGGALLDVGIYAVSFVSMATGRQPDSIHSRAHIGETGVDEYFSAMFGYADGCVAHVTAGLRLKSKHEAVILGTRGEIRVPDFWRAKQAELTVYDKSTEVYTDTSEGGLIYEAEEAMGCLRAGKPESAVMPLDESLRIMETMDAMRANWGLVYPGERPI